MVRIKAQLRMTDLHIQGNIPILYLNEYSLQM